jgi:long-chain acyl-CoA synthetase
MKGYWDNPQSTQEAIREGWLHTGDLAKRDEDGYYYVVERKKDMILTSGFNVYPREVEEMIFQHPKVGEVAVAGMPDERRGEVAKAFVVLKAGTACSEQEIIEWCQERMARYKVPREVEFVESLPKSLAGKVLRRVLREKAG